MRATRLSLTYLAQVRRFYALVLPIPVLQSLIYRLIVITMLHFSLTKLRENAMGLRKAVATTGIVRGAVR